MMKETQESYFSKTIEKGLKILNLFNQGRTRLSLKMISEEIGINKTSAFRYINTLVQLGYLKKDPQTKLLEIGPKAVYLSYTITKSFNLLQIIKPLVDDASKTHNVTVHCGLIDGDAIWMIYQKQARETLTFIQPSVIFNEWHCTAMGKAVLSHLPKKEMLGIVDRLNLIKKTSNSITRKDILLSQLAAAKKKGYSLNDEELIPGLVSIAAPLFNMEKNRPIGAICFDLPTIQCSVGEAERKYAKLIVRLANDISEMKSLG